MSKNLKLKVSPSLHVNIEMQRQDLSGVHKDTGKLPKAKVIQFQFKMAFFVDRLAQVCAVITFVLMARVAWGNRFGYNDAFENEKRETLVGGQTPIPKEKLNDHTDLILGIVKAEAKMDSHFAFVKDSLQATSQVVQGIMYRVKIDAQPKSCSASATCDVVKHCSFKIWSRVWLPDEDEKLKILDFACTDV